MSMKRNAGPIPCHVTQGCGDVLASSYSEMAGIPLSWIGFFFYAVVFSCAVFEMSGFRGALRWIFWPALGAFGISIVLVGIQAFVLRAFCEYCLLSAGLVTTIFLLSPRPRQSAETQSGKLSAAGVRDGQR